MYQKHVTTVLRCAMLVALVTILSASSAFSQVPTMDGTVVGDEALYGAALSTQNTPTGFGDGFLGDQIANGGGSEIDQLFAHIANGRLYVMVTGNLQENFNKLSFFFDTRPGGHNQLDGSMLPLGVEPFMGGFGSTAGALQQQNGLTFDTGFEADYFLTMNNGFEVALDDPNATGNPIKFWATSAHYSDMTVGAAADRQNVAAGMQLAPQGLPNVLRFDHLNNPKTFADYPYGCGDNPNVVCNVPFDIFSGTTVPTHIGPALPNLSHGELIDRNYVLDPAGGACADDTGAGCLATELGFALDQSPTDPTNSLSHRNFNNLIDLELAVDNSNVGGVTDSSVVNVADAATGIEFSIPLSELGNPSGDFRVVGFVNNDVHNYLSNQFIGEGVMSGNLGGDGMGGCSHPPDCVDLSGVDLSQIAGDQFVTIPYSPPTVTGDFNGDGSWDCADINALVAEIATGGTDLSFDMNSDGTIDFDDITDPGTGWLAVGGANTPGTPSGNPYLVGDANLDGVVDGLDFIEWNENKFTNLPEWCGGDFNADGIVDGLDFIQWNTFKFTSSDAAAVAVPEPATGLMLLVGCLLFVRTGRR